MAEADLGGGLGETVFDLGLGRHTVSGDQGRDALHLDWSNLKIGVSGGVSGSAKNGHAGQIAWRNDLGPLDIGAGWAEVSPQAAFSPRDTGDPFQFDGALWMSNGYHVGGGNSRDLWKSTDGGASWSLVKDATPYDAYSRIEVLNGYMYAIRGTVWRSSDGVNWEEISTRTPFENAQDRFEMRATVFKDRLWVVAPTAVWSSDDGVNWTKEADLPFDPRFNFALTVFDGKLVLAGGFTAIPNTPAELGYPGFTSFNDVWTSEDGRSWEVATGVASWGARQWLHMEEVDGLLYVFGGYSNRENRNLNDMWVSRDGVTWTEVRQDQVWSGRHWSSVYVVDDKIVLAGGNDSVPGVARLRNDVWTYTDNGQLSSVDFTGIERFDIQLGAGPNDLQLGNGADRVVGGDGHDTVRGEGGDDEIMGGDGSDHLFGGQGDDVLDGGVGADRLEGGLGNDVYAVDDAEDVVEEAADEGSDEVRTGLASFSIAAWADVERLTGLSDEGQTLTGNAGANVITGGSGDDALNGGDGADKLDGGAGADALDGGDGDDTYIVDDEADSVEEAADGGVDLVRTNLASYSIALAQHIENLSGTSAAGQALTGNDGVNVIEGGAADDVLDGGAGGDTLSGGAGDDVYLVDDTGDVINERAAEGFDKIRTSLSAYSIVALANVESLIGASATGQALTGNAGANVIAAGAGDDKLDGGAGADAMAGGAGDDTYIVDDIGDTIAEVAEGGADWIRTDLAVFSLAAFDQVEHLSGTAAGGQTLIGNASKNIIVGDIGNDMLNGGAGADRITGGNGDDRLFGGGSQEDRFLAAFAWLTEDQGGEPWYVADFDGDGRDDVFRYAPNVSGAEVFLSTGHSFQESGSWTLAGHGVEPWFIGDFNGDARADIFRYLPKQSGAEVFLSTGHSFVSAGSWTGAGYGDSRWLVGDFNGDGKDDLGRYTKADQRFQVLLSTGSGFASPVTWAVASSGDSGWLIGDYNGDGRADLGRGSTSGVEVLLSTGTGFGAAETWHAKDVGGQWRARDADGDGRDDILLLSDKGVHALMSTGERFKAPIQLLNNDAGSVSWALGDFDGDAGVDLLRQDPTMGVQIRRGGESSNDVFQFATNFGHDVVADFEKTDVIHFASQVFASFDQVRAEAKAVEGGVLITVDPSNSLTLLGVALGDITPDHFSFG